MKLQFGAWADGLFVSLCCRWGPPEVVRLDNGTEFANAIVESVSGRQRSKVVNVRLLKPQPEPVIQALAQSVVSDVDGFHSDNSEDDFDFLLDPSADASNPRLRSGYGLRPPAALQSPLRCGIA